MCNHIWVTKELYNDIFLFFYSHFMKCIKMLGTPIKPGFEALLSKLSSLFYKVLLANQEKLRFSDKNEA